MTDNNLKDGLWRISWDTHWGRRTQFFVVCDGQISINEKHKKLHSPLTNREGQTIDSLLEAMLEPDWPWPGTEIQALFPESYEEMYG